VYNVLVIIKGKLLEPSLGAAKVGARTRLVDIAGHKTKA
jgi:hypothetical protein